jgi:hypothetical protein
MNLRPRCIIGEETGVGLIELLIGMVLAGFIAIAVFSILSSTFRSRSAAEALNGRAVRAILMKEALEHTVTNAGYTAYTMSAGVPAPCAIAGSAVLPPLPVSSAVSALTVQWTAANGGACSACSGTFSLQGNVAAWTVSGGPSCGQGSAGQSQAVIPVGTGWTLSVATGTNCLGPAFGTTAPAVIATNSNSQAPGTAPVEVSACLFNLQGQ